MRECVHLHFVNLQVATDFLECEDQEIRVKLAWNLNQFSRCHVLHCDLKPVGVFQNYLALLKKALGQVSGGQANRNSPRWKTSLSR